MRIAITGPHGGGKTTLLNALVKTKEFSGLDVLPEVTRLIKEAGLDINELGSDETQILVLAKHMQNLILHKNFIVDRCLLDGLVYTEYLSEHGKVSSYLVDYAMNLLEDHLRDYDLVLYIPAEFEPADDGVRSIAKEFHDWIVKHFEWKVRCIQLAEEVNLVELRGTVEERVARAIKAIRRIPECRIC